jgi:dipeptidyl aminopeptidase/acylaminoacyl peptidase
MRAPGRHASRARSWIAARTSRSPPPLAPALRAISGHFPGQSLRLFPDVAARIWLIAETDARLQWPRYHLFDATTGCFTRVLEDPPALPEAALARKLAVAYRASDGMLLNGLLSLPPGEDPARLPLIVEVHGGPWSRAPAGYDAVTQFLVNRGYAVFEPNFRGSAGFGRAYVQAAKGDFGDGRVQRDVIEGAAWLLAHGIGDRARVGIIGHSYGGYSALVGLTSSPGLFRVGVASAAPPDFGAALRLRVEREASEPGAQVPLAAELRLRSIDLDDPRTAARLRTESPDQNAEKLRGPLLLVAGGNDDRVPLRTINEYAARLKALGKDVSLLVDDASGHGLDSSLAKEGYLYLLEQLLHRPLGGMTSSALGAPLAGYLDRQLRLAGPSLAGAVPHPLSDR